MSLKSIKNNNNEIKTQKIKFKFIQNIYSFIY